MANPSQVCYIPPSPRRAGDTDYRFNSDLGFMSGWTEDEIKEMLEKLRHQHRNLDYMINKLEDQGSDMLTIQRLKKRKLQLKDLVARLESMLIPDIIA